MNEFNLALLNGLTDEQKNYVLTKKASNEKKLSTAYLCWFLFGVHYFYLDKPIKNIIYILTGGGFIIWAVICLFTMKSLVNNYNNKKLAQYIEEAKVLYKDNRDLETV